MATTGYHLTMRNVIDHLQTPNSAPKSILCQIVAGLQGNWVEETKGAMAMDGEYRPCKMLVRGGEIGRSESRGWKKRSFAMMVVVGKGKGFTFRIFFSSSLPLRWEGMPGSEDWIFTVLPQLVNVIITAVELRLTSLLFLWIV